MYELINLSANNLSTNSWYIQSPTNIGLFKIDNSRVIVIDSGNDKDAAKKILSIIQSNNWHLEMIINTHSNADHVGGNAYLQEKTNCRIVATRQEAVFITDPILESSFLFGAYPNSKLRNKFLMAQPSKVTDVISCDTVSNPPSESNTPKPHAASCNEICGIGLQAMPLPGHFMGMIGIMTPDKVFFAGDSIFSEMVVNKYHVTFIYDVKSFLETLSMLEQIQANFFVPSHAAPVRDIKPLVKINREKIHEIIELILKLCTEPINFEILLKNIMDHYSLRLDFNQYVLVGGTVKSYLSYLYDLKQIDAIFENNILLWKRV
jgi:glyoxylase-like metal-dependent hydrolase (beta-lactamase superfamily II)